MIAQGHAVKGLQMSAKSTSGRLLFDDIIRMAVTLLD
jgi:hypothetical protein